MRFFVIIGIVAIVGGFSLALSGTTTLGGVLLILLGLAIEGITGALAIARNLRDSVMEWKELLTTGPGAVRLVGFSPPKGMFFRREASLTFEVEGTEGQKKRLERGLKIPIPQAILWKLSGRVPLPLVGALNREADMNVHLWRRR